MDGSETSSEEFIQTGAGSTGNPLTNCSGSRLSLNVHRPRVGCRRQLRNAGGVDIPGQRRRGAARSVAAGDPDLADLYAARAARSVGRQNRHPIVDSQPTQPVELVELRL